MRQEDESSAPQGPSLAAPDISLTGRAGGVRVEGVCERQVQDSLGIADPASDYIPKARNFQTHAREQS